MGAAPERWWTTRVNFLREYRSNMRTVGAVAPSSKYLARKMLQDIDFDTVRLLVEYGPGSGVFTDELLRRKHPDAHLLVIEANETFHGNLHRRYGHRPDIRLVHGSAEEIGAQLTDFDHGMQIDHIVSGLPFAALPATVSHRILQGVVDHLGPGGSFITFQYTPFKKDLLRRYFPVMLSRLELRNIPPAVVYDCRLS